MRHRVGPQFLCRHPKKCRVWQVSSSSQAGGSYGSVYGPVGGQQHSHLRLLLQVTCSSHTDDRPCALLFGLSSESGVKEKICLCPWQIPGAKPTASVFNIISALVQRQTSQWESKQQDVHLLGLSHMSHLPLQVASRAAPVWLTLMSPHTQHLTPIPCHIPT